MPRSKRDKKISLTKTSKKGLPLKQKIIEDVRTCVEQFQNIYVLSYKNMRNTSMKEVRAHWKPSRFFFGKNRVIALGLGRNKEEEVADGLHKVAKSLKGQRVLLFTNSDKEEVVEFFKTYSCEEFARSGFKATQAVVLDEGPLKQFPHSIEPYLRKLGLPTKLEKGVVTLLKDFEVCKEGSILTPEQAKILELIDIRMATFKLKLRAHWNKETGFEKIKWVKSQNGENDENMDEENDDKMDEDNEQDDDDEEDDVNGEDDDNEH